jgi:hypothetical protein
MHPRRTLESLALSLLLLAAACGGQQEIGAASASSALTAAPRGAVLLDARAYRAPGLVTITVADSNLGWRAERGPTARISSTTTPRGVLVDLKQTGPGTGLFQGTARLSLSWNDETLRVRNGDAITVAYRDANDGAGREVTVTATAVVDDVSPDLRETGVAGPATARAGSSIDVSDAVSNDARGGATGAAFTVALYISPTAAFDPLTATPLALRGEGPLAAGESHAATTTVALPTDLPGGVYYYVAVADSTAAVSELNEDDNVRVGNAVTVEGLPLADLATTSLSAWTTIYDTIQVSHTVSNAAGARPTGDAFLVDFHLSPTAAFDAATAPYLGRRLVDPLAAGESSSASSELPLPAGLPGGAYFLVAVVDAGADIPESDEGNNVLVGGQITVDERPRADLTIAAVASPPAATAGGTLSVSDTVANAPGTRPSQGSYYLFTVNFYLSTSPWFDGLWTYLGQRWVSILAGGQSSSATTALINTGCARGRGHVPLPALHEQATPARLLC